MTLDDMFPNAARDCLEKITLRTARHGDQWKVKNIEELEHHFYNELIELSVENRYSSQYRRELIDVVNVGLMLIERLYERK